MIARFTILSLLFLIGTLATETWAQGKWGGGGAKSKWSSINPKDSTGQAEGNYQLHCAQCHGVNGDGKGDLAAVLGVPPRNHTDASIMSTRTDDDIFKVISEGGPAMGFDSAMPPHKTVMSEQEIKDLVKYIRKLCNCKYGGK
ncbi:hypothetical protein MNBD_NITROSPINAE01-142 [hydrothermal vent metagenome]|uniref:Cytochrome c domain-containing protein n=1 Tax=hydrothermal vent metagenome TaxID=652676 RepID=A0A3B1CK87_9ZZZZ